MRLVLQVLGVCMLVIVVAAASGLLVLTHEGTALDSESKAFVDRAVVAIASGWSQEQLLSRASPEFRATTSSSQISGLFETLSLLGAMVEYQGATGEAKISYSWGGGRSISASYIAQARFRNGAATFRITLVKRGNVWMIRSFHVDFAPTTPTERNT